MGEALEENGHLLSPMSPYDAGAGIDEGGGDLEALSATILHNVADVGAEDSEVGAGGRGGKGVSLLSPVPERGEESSVYVSPSSAASPWLSGPVGEAAERGGESEDELGSSARSGGAGSKELQQRSALPVPAEPPERWVATGVCAGQSSPHALGAGRSAQPAVHGAGRETQLGGMRGRNEGAGPKSPDLVVCSLSHTLETHTDAVNAVVLLPSARPGALPQVVSASSDGTAAVWDLLAEGGGAGGGGNVRHLLAADGGRVWAIAVSQGAGKEDSALVASAHHDGVVRVWDSATGLLTVPGMRGSCHSLNSVASAARIACVPCLPGWPHFLSLCGLSARSLLSASPWHCFAHAKRFTGIRRRWIRVTARSRLWRFFELQPPPPPRAVRQAA